MPVAIKTIRVDCADQTATDEFMKEAKLMMQYVHHNVIRFYGVAADENPLLLVMELCPNGSLDKYLIVARQLPNTTPSKHRGNITITEKLQMCLDGARGMAYLVEKKKCIHRDLAARNCLVGPQREVKIADFGLSQHGAPTQMHQKTRIAVKWTAPEVIQNNRCTFESDVWSFAVVIWEILAEGVEPWSECDNKQALIAMLAGQTLTPATETPRQLQDLLYRCWNLDPTFRPTMEQCRQELEKLVNRLSVCPIEAEFFGNQRGRQAQERAGAAYGANFALPGNNQLGNNLGLFNGQHTFATHTYPGFHQQTFPPSPQTLSAPNLAQGGIHSNDKLCIPQTNLAPADSPAIQFGANGQGGNILHTYPGKICIRH